MSPDVLILSGPTAAGKNTVGGLLARRRERCAIVDVDLVRAMFVQPHRAPWEGDEGWRQQRLGVLQACRLAASFLDDGWDVVILDVLSARTLPLYRQHLGPARLFVVQLLPDWPTCRRRFQDRGPVLTAEEFAAVYQQQVAFAGYDLLIDNSALSAEATVAYIDAAR